MIEKSCYLAALGRLTVREYGTAELRRYLLKKGFHETEVAQTIGRLKEEGALSETRYISAMIRSQASRDKGPAYIRQKLQEKGVSISLPEVRNLFEEHSPRDELILIRTVINRRYLNAHKDEKSLNRAYQGLLRRGFSPELIRKALKELK